MRKLTAICSTGPYDNGYPVLHILEAPETIPGLKSFVGEATFTQAWLLLHEALAQENSRRRSHGLGPLKLTEA